MVDVGYCCLEKGNLYFEGDAFMSCGQGEGEGL